METEYEPNRELPWGVDGKVSNCGLQRVSPRCWRRRAAVREERLLQNEGQALRVELNSLIWRTVFPWLRSMGAAALIATVLLPGSMVALTSEGSVSVWGGGQQGLPAGLTNVAAISTAVDHSLALLADGKVVAWGYNFDNQCSVPSNLGPVIGIAAGAFFSVALRSDGTVVAWGDDQFSQTDVPPGATNVTAVSAGLGHVLALRSDTTVAAWGSDVCGQCDMPSGLSNVVAVLAAWNYSLALRADGVVVAWGSEEAGQTEVPPGLSNVTAIAGNMDYCLALKKDGSVAAWGRAPVPPAGLSNLKAVAAGQNHCLGLMSDGTIVVWGRNDSGQINVPPGLAKVSGLGAGWNYSIALVAAGAQPSALVLGNAAWQAGVFSISVPTRTNTSYVLQFKQALSDPSWTDLNTVSATANTITLTDPAAMSAHGFYRVREQ
jgi:hypothetical protein